LYQATREALRVLGVVTRALASPHPETEIGTAIPDPKIRDTALTAMQQIAPTGRKGVDAVEIGGRSLQTEKFTKLTPQVRRTIKSMTDHPVRSAETAEFIGVVREIDLDIRRLEIRRIRQADLEEVRVAYPSSLDTLAEKLTNRKVRVSGTLERSPEGKAKLLEAKDIVLIEEPDGLGENEAGL
jgi:hypothetical protein